MFIVRGKRHPINFFKKGVTIIIMSSILNLFNLIYLASYVNFSIWTNAEVFTAIVDLEYLIETHKRTIEDLDNYLNKEAYRLSLLKRHLDIFKREHQRAVEDIPNYVGNPINAYTLIKRLTTDLSYIEYSVNAECMENFTLNHKEYKYPVLEDLKGAAQAITRLQKTYNLDIKDLAEGKLNGINYSSPMNAGDCFELGRILYNEADFKNAGAWTMEALLKYQHEDIPYYFTESQIIQHIGSVIYALGLNGTDWAKSLLLKPTTEKDKIQELKQVDDEYRLKINEKKYDLEKETVNSDKSTFYEALCRGEIDLPAEKSKKLTCRYMTENDPFLRIAPIKVEYVHLNPDVIVFHEVISDAEINEIKTLAKPRFTRALVIDAVTAEPVASKNRISKFAWLNDQESPTIARISRRVTHMTGLTMETAEILQVGNYGIGGHYHPHYDFFSEEFTTEHSTGNRIATVLFYMSEVAQGGATVFTELGVSVFPVYRGAVFWFNLHPSGDGNLATKHAACPVLQGFKWVANKWIHEVGQEFRFPCYPEHRDISNRKKYL